MSEPAVNMLMTVSLTEPLCRSFNDVFAFLQKQAHRPFLHRYLKRDEILRSIAGCDARLSDALGQFGVCQSYLKFLFRGAYYLSIKP